VAVSFLKLPKYTGFRVFLHLYQAFLIVFNLLRFAVPVRFYGMSFGFKPGSLPFQPARVFLV
jgi:hypothetical protein